MKQQYEIEIKVLLGKKANAEKLLKKLQKNDPHLKKIGQGKQLNHYFLTGDFAKLEKSIRAQIKKSEQELLSEIIHQGKNHSVRTRGTEKKVILVVKSSQDEATSANGTSRMEFEAEFKNISLDELDKLLLNSGFDYQAKWSREREEYLYKDYHVTIDKNAGYGYLAEFERVINDEKKVATTKKEIQTELQKLGLKELPQARLERMFAHYNKNWRHYYGTDKTFTIR